MAADEVRSLSFHTQKATEQIKLVMVNLTGNAQEVVAAMNRSKLCVYVGQRNASQVSVELESVLCDLNEITEITQVISQSTTEQVHNGQSLNNNIMMINEAAQKMTQLSQNNNHQATSLDELVLLNIGVYI